MKLFILFCLICSTAFCRPVIIDSHFHFFSPQNIDKIPHANAVIGAEQAYKQMQRAAVDAVVALSAAYMLELESDAKAENDFVISQAKIIPSRIIPFCSVNIKAQWSLREVDRCHRLGARGLKIYLTEDRLSLQDKENYNTVNSLFNKTASLGLPVLIEFNKSDVNEFLKLVKLMTTNPGSNFIIAHALAANFKDLAYIPIIYTENPQLPRNIYVDISDTVDLYKDSPQAQSLVWHLRKLGVDRVFFGSDAPYFSIKESILALNNYPFTSKELRKIRGDNFRRFLGL